MFPREKVVQISEDSVSYFPCTVSQRVSQFQINTFRRRKKRKGKKVLEKSWMGCKKWPKRQLLSFFARIEQKQGGGGEEKIEKKVKN